MNRNNVEKKKRPVWPWILGLILALLLIIFFPKPFSEAEEPLPLTTRGDTILAVPPDVYEYLAFMEAAPPLQDTYSLSQYTWEALQKMANAISALALATNTHELSVSSFKTKAWNTGDQIKAEGLTNENLDGLKNTFVEALEVLQTIQKAKFKDLAPKIAELKQTVDKIDKTDLRPHPTEPIQDVFKKAALVMQEMANRMSPTN
jgi:hypothetical protein